MTHHSHHVSASPEDAGLRLDKFLATKLPELSRSRIQSLLEQGHIKRGGASIQEASRKVKSGDRFDITIPEVAPSHLIAQDIPLDIVYEDKHLLIINKPAGLTVHPGAGNPDKTLVNALLAHCGETLSGVGGVARPGIVHRIDKETSGLLVAAKNDIAHIHLSQQLAARTLKRTYHALVWGVPKPKAGTITGNIGRSFSNRQKMAVVKSGGKPAVTHYRTLTLPLSRSAGEGSAHSRAGEGLFSILECNLETGRTHQIRVHLTHIGHPIVGDPVYGQLTSQRLNAKIYKSLPEKTRKALLAFNRQALHAKELALIHPHTHKTMRFECELPEDMAELISILSS